MKMKTKIESSMRFYLLATKLKELIRTGWDDTHWCILGRRESVAEHVYGCLILALAIDANFDLNLNLDKVLKMLALHEIGEVIIGDITPYDGMTKEEKEKKEHEAMEKVIGDVIKKEELYTLLLEFDAKKTKEAKFAHLCDKIEADIQSKIYQDKGRHHSLSEQQNNVAFKNSKVQNMAKEKKEDAFSIWYEMDKELYKDDLLFKTILTYIKENDLNI